MSEDTLTPEIIRDAVGGRLADECNIQHHYGYSTVDFKLNVISPSEILLALTEGDRLASWKALFETSNLVPMQLYKDNGYHLSFTLEDGLLEHAKAMFPGKDFSLLFAPLNEYCRRGQQMQWGEGPEFDVPPDLKQQLEGVPRNLIAEHIIEALTGGKILMLPENGKADPINKSTQAFAALLSKHWPAPQTYELMANTSTHSQDYRIEFASSEQAQQFRGMLNALIRNAPDESVGFADFATIATTRATIVRVDANQLHTLMKLPDIAERIAAIPAPAITR